MMLLHFLEKIDLECVDSTNEFIAKKALRIDGKGKKGLREALGVGNNCNCCDTYSLTETKSVFIEISDLIKQLNFLKEKQKNQDISKGLKKDLESYVKEPIKYIIQELKLKVFGNLIILFKIPIKFNVRHESVHQKEVEVIFVLCSNGSDDVRIFDYLKTDIHNALNPLLEKVNIVNIPMFKAYLEKKVTVTKL